MGLYNYPVLMAADIVIVDADVVPVGADQKQHVEITRDIVDAFNRTFGDTLVSPEPLIEASVATIAGLDGRKMSASYGNTIPVFVDPKTQRKLVMRIVTDSRPPSEPKDPATDHLFQMFEHVGAPGDVDDVRKRYATGGIGYGEVKELLADALDAQFTAPREQFNALMANRAEVDRILADGAERARAVASRTLARVRRAVGIGG
jgi:tryptophanyl-tRNA synthetase